MWLQKDPSDGQHACLVKRRESRWEERGGALHKRDRDSWKITSGQLQESFQDETNHRKWQEKSASLYGSRTAICLERNWVKMQWNKPWGRIWEARVPVGERNRERHIVPDSHYFRVSVALRPQKSSGLLGTSKLQVKTRWHFIAAFYRYKGLGFCIHGVPLQATPREKFRSGHTECLRNGQRERVKTDTARQADKRRVIPWRW